MNSHLLFNVSVVTPREVIENGAVFVHNGLIEAVGTMPRKIPQGYSAIDGQGRWLIPGMIDLHNDSIEKEIEPRPDALIPVDIALFALEGRLVSHGITSVYHSLAFMEGETAVRTAPMVTFNIREINRLKHLGLIRHQIHARYDITEKGFSAILTDMIEKGQVQLLSFMDHTPGQGQYWKMDVFRDYYAKKHPHLGEAGIDQLIEKRRSRTQAGNNNEMLDLIAERAGRYNLPVASHDDDSPDRIAFMKKKGVTISEFPVNLETALDAATQGMHVVVGAPNIVRGISNSGNMRALDAIGNHAAHIICSDYMSSSMLHAVFQLHNKHGIAMSEAVKMATLNPAKAVGCDDRLGSIEAGKVADMALITEIDGLPFVEQVFVAGYQVMCKKRSYAQCIGMNSYQQGERVCL
ncbi:MAG: alpha-D-ribose 1-methylphosphonate 5-triphosphate diphosphatase [Negativicutes bacterium]|nr:alpha-D-ribose 1-methylphosphonate 5-triphosphate diphosphatase [Negativicutes bacterium]